MTRRADRQNGAQAQTALKAKLPALIVLHREHTNLGAVGCWLLEQGYGVDIRRPIFGEKLPTTLSAHSCAVIFGGPMSVNDSVAHIAQETDWIGVALQEKKPFLGICLGGQMLAKCLGARVKRDPGHSVEIGYHAIEPTQHGGDLGPWPSRVYQWHNEGFELPASTKLLARGGHAFPNQAFKFGDHAVGLQFHPEMTHALIARWTVNGRPNGSILSAKVRESQLEDHIVHGSIVQTWLDRLMRGLLETATKPISPSNICHSERVVVSNAGAP